MPGFKLLLLVTIAVISCTPSDRANEVGAPSCEEANIREVVGAFGERLRNVSRQAPESIVVREVRQQYAPYVTRDLLAKWTAAPQSAPGRDVSSPWPDRIEVRVIRAEAPGVCRAVGQIVSASSTGDLPERTPVSLLLRYEDGRWRIGSYAAESVASDSTSAAAAAEVVRRYYAAIRAKDYAAAYALREPGATPGKTLDQLAADFAQTTHVEAAIGSASRVEGAAGSRYATVPVEVRTVLANGDNHRFKGTYTLRRSVVDGASAEERRWRIYAANLRQVR